jgi:hypothetical protein
MFRGFTGSMKDNDDKSSGMSEHKKSDEDMKSENAKSDAINIQSKTNEPVESPEDRRMAFAQAAASSFEKNQLWDNFD